MPASTADGAADNPRQAGQPDAVGSQLFFAEILGITGDSGARFLVGKHVEVVAEVEMADDAVLRDFDTTESLATLPARLRPDFVPEGTAR
jgi:CTP:molybdopterin cytidylyltransferase MocA